MERRPSASCCDKPFFAAKGEGRATRTPSDPLVIWLHFFPSPFDHFKPSFFCFSCNRWKAEAGYSFGQKPTPLSQRLLSLGRGEGGDLKRKMENRTMSDEMIHTYTRAEAIADGVLVDVSEMAKEARFKYPVALTRAAYVKYVEVPEGMTGQDEQGRLWDILNMLRFAAVKSRGESEILFKLYVRVQKGDRKPRLVTLKSVCGPNDDASPCITVMMPDED
jgi:hypothetical protein